MSFKVNIKLSGVGETFSIDVTLEDTVEQIIVKCVEARSDLEPERVTLVYKGRILKPEQTAESLKLSEDVIIHLVRKPSPKPKPAASTPASSATTPAASTLGLGTSSAASGTSGASSFSAPNPFAGLSGASIPGLSAGGGLTGMGGMNMDPNTVSSMMNNPMFRQMMENLLQNPEMMNSMIDNNPNLRAMAEQNPEFRDLLQNPDLMRNAMTPEAIQASMNLMNNANSNSMFGTMSGAAGSMPMPGTSSSSSSAPSGDQPSTGGATGTSTTGAGATGTTGTGAAMPDLFSGLGGSGIGGAGLGGTDMNATLQSMGGIEGVQNMMSNMDPNVLNSLMSGMGIGSGAGLGGGLPGAGLGAFGGAGGVGGLGPGTGVFGTSPPVTTETEEELREKYATQLQQMKDMGFTDEDTNLDMLKQ